MSKAANSELVDLMRAAAQPARAVAMRAYMRDQFPFLGLPNPQLREVVRQARLPKPTQAQLAEQARELWALPEREFQYVACTQLRKHVSVCGPGFIDVVRDLVVTKSWWDTIDTLASHTVGPLVRAHPELVSTMDAWIRDDNMWLVRTAILHQLGYQQATDSARLYRYLGMQFAHKDFFIRKAIGWALREYAKTDPESVRAFVKANDSKLSGLSKREALKNIGG